MIAHISTKLTNLHKRKCKVRIIENQKKIIFDNNIVIIFNSINLNHTNIRYVIYAYIWIYMNVTKKILNQCIPM